MNTVKFMKWTLKPIEDEYVGLDDIVCVNGITGWLDFMGRDIIAVVDEKKVSHRIPIKEIQTFYKLSTFVEGNLTNVSIKELLCS